MSVLEFLSQTSLTTKDKIGRMRSSNALSSLRRTPFVIPAIVACCLMLVSAGIVDQNKGFSVTKKYVAHKNTTPGTSQALLTANAIDSKPQDATTQSNSLQQEQNRPTPTTQKNSSSSAAQPAASGLLISPYAVSLSPTKTCQVLTISGPGGKSVITQPTLSFSEGVMFASVTYEGQYPKVWSATLCRTSATISGSYSPTISARLSDASTATASIYATVVGQPYFTGTQGPMTSTDNGSTVTYTFHFSIQPLANFGNPTLRFSLQSDINCIPAQSLTNIEGPYNGINDYNLSCTYDKATLRARGSDVSVSIKGGGDNVISDMKLSYIVPALY